MAARLRFDPEGCNGLSAALVEWSIKMTGGAGLGDDRPGDPTHPRADLGVLVLVDPVEAERFAERVDDGEGDAGRLTMSMTWATAAPSNGVAGRT